MIYNWVVRADAAAGKAPDRQRYPFELQPTINITIIYDCSCLGKLNYIKTSIDAGADVHYATEDNDTPLLRCCQLAPPEAEKCIKYLIKRGADTNQQVSFTFTLQVYFLYQIYYNLKFHHNVQLSRLLQW